MLRSWATAKVAHQTSDIRRHTQAHKAQTLHPVSLERYYSPAPPGYNSSWQQLQAQASQTPRVTWCVSASFHLCQVGHAHDTFAAAKWTVLQAPSSGWPGWLLEAVIRQHHQQPLQQQQGQMPLTI